MPNLNEISQESRKYATQSVPFDRIARTAVRRPVVPVVVRTKLGQRSSVFGEIRD